MQANKANIVLRATKGFPLTHVEMDTNLNEIINVIEDIAGSSGVVKQAVDARDAAESFAVETLGTKSEVQTLTMEAQQAVLDAEAKVDVLRDELAEPIGSKTLGNRGTTVYDSLDLSGSRSKTAVRGGQLAQLRSDLEDPFCQRTDVNLIGDSITWGMTVLGGSGTDPRTGTLTDPRNNLTSPSWANLLHQWLGRQYFRLATPTSTTTAQAVYTKTVDLWPATPSFALSAYDTSEGVLANTGTTLRFYIDYVNDGKSISWDMYGDEFTYVYAQLGNGADYELFVDSVSQGTFSTVGTAAFKTTRTHTFALGKHKIQIVKRGATSTVLRTEAIRINKTLTFTNNGIIGRSTANWLPGAGLLDTAVKISDRYVFIMLGTNDRAQTNQPTSPTRITENLFSILAWLQNQRPLARPVLISANEADQDVGATYFYDMHAVRRAISDAARAKAVDFVDYYEVTREALSAGVPFLSDGLHPNDLGHYLLSRVIIDSIRNSDSGSYGRGLSLTTRSTLDVNDPTMSGSYYAGSATANKPVDETAIVEAYQQGDGRMFQWFLPLSGARPFIRVRSSLGVFTSRELALRSESMQVSGGAMTGVFKAAPFTLATLPAVTGNTGGIIWVSDLTGGAFHCYCDGTAWRRNDTKAIAS